MFNSNLCVKCEEVVTDPVCRRCYLKETEILLNDLRLSPMVNEIILTKLKKNFPIETINSTKCVLCRKENITLCRYCFSIILVRILRELNFTEDLIETFEYNSMNGESIEEETECDTEDDVDYLQI